MLLALGPWFLLLCLPRGIASQQCSPRSLAQHLNPSVEEIWSFPTHNRLYEGNSSLWRKAKDADKLIPTSAGVSPPYKAVVLYYYAPHDPYSRSLRPVMECLPKFFPPSVLFFAVDHSRLPTTMQLNNGILGTPTIRLLRVNREDKQFHYALRERNLTALISFVETMGHVKAVATPAAFWTPGGPHRSTCIAQPHPVRAADIQELGWNRWMLVACLFLTLVAVEEWATRRQAF